MSFFQSATLKKNLAIACYTTATFHWVPLHSNEVLQNSDTLHYCTILLSKKYDKKIKHVSSSRWNLSHNHTLLTHLDSKPLTKCMYQFHSVLQKPLSFIGASGLIALQLFHVYILQFSAMQWYAILMICYNILMLCY